MISGASFAFYYIMKDMSLFKFYTKSFSRNASNFTIPNTFLMIKAFFFFSTAWFYLIYFVLYCYWATLWKKIEMFSNCLGHVVHHHEINYFLYTLNKNCTVSLYNVNVMFNSYIIFSYIRRKVRFILYH